jgi:hypothetical protein
LTPSAPITTGRRRRAASKRTVRCRPPIERVARTPSRKSARRGRLLGQVRVEPPPLRHQHERPLVRPLEARP